MMARTLGLSLEEMSTKGLEWKENIVISSMCTVFAESNVVSLVAQNPGIIKALEEKLGAKLYICDEAQLCGALGAASFAYGSAVCRGCVCNHRTLFYIA